MNAPTWLLAWDRGSVVWAAGLGRACWQGGCALLIVWLLCRGFSSMSPALRAWLWRLAYLKLVLALLPTLSIPILPPQSGAQPTVSAVASSSENTPPSDSQAGAPPVESAAVAPPPAAPSMPASSPSVRLRWTFWLSLLWGVGVLCCLAQVAGEWIAAGWLRGLSEPIEDDALVACCLELSERLGMREPPQLMVSDGAGSPVLLGGARPAIILPLALLNDCTPAELEMVIAHELAHRSRRDLLWGWLPALGHALFFFFPLEWLAAHEYRLAQEMACDELAIRTAQAGVGDYGDALLKVAARHRPNLQSRLVTVGIVESSQILKRRLLAMKAISPLPAQPGMIVTVIVSLGMLFCIPWQFTPRAHATDVATGGSNLSPTTPAGSADLASHEQPDPAAVPVAAASLRYHPKVGESYVYAVRIESTEPDYTETMSGNAIYRCRATAENGLVLTCSGGLAPTRRAAPATAFPVSPFQRLHAFGFGALGMPQPFAGPNEIKIDALGHLLSARGETPLPRALGDLSQMIVETLPAEGDSWQVQNGCAVLLQTSSSSIPFVRGGSGMFGHDTARHLPAAETVSYTLGATSGDTTQIAKHYVLRTNEQTAGAPTLQLTGDGTVDFDRKLGMPRRMEFKLTLTEQPDRATTTHIPVTVTYHLLEGEEREKALHPPAAPPPTLKPLAAAERASTLTDLRSEDGFKVIGAANRLAGAKPEGDTQAIEQALIGALEHKDGFARQAVVKALGVWGDSDSVPPLIRRLADESFAVRWAAFDALVEKRDVRAAEPIAKWLEKDRGFASNALRKMGPMAAPAVARQLDAKDWGMRIDLCRLLKEIGTPREIPALEKLTRDEQRLVVDAAADAIAAIRRRSQ